MSPEPSATPKPEPPKKNGRPDAPSVAATKKNYVPTYFYTFERPGFSYSPINIEHDAAGKGQISMKKDAYDDVFTDPIQLSPATLEGLNNAFDELKFIDSTDDYQYPGHDYSNMGNLTITLKKDGRERTVKYNWTDNKEAKFLMDEYRRISNEYTWRLDILTARENQPLQTPGLMEALDSYYQRNELTDPSHLLPFLTELSNDERLPLMARNRATKLIKQIQKAAAKKS
jgi:hypothetical protein